MTNVKKSTKTFDASSPGFLYTVLVGVLTIFTVSGVHFPTPAEQLAGDLVSTLSQGGIYALIGVLVSSVIFPIWNAAKFGLKSLKEIFSSVLTWIALGNILLAAVALTGFVLPDGTLEQVILAVQMKDWSALAGVLFTTIIPTLVRFIKDKKAA